MPMDQNQQKEQFSVAYLKAVAAAAGYNIYQPEVDDSSIDWGLKGYKADGLRYTPQLELQLKCTAKSDYLIRETIPYDLKQKNYNDLCEEDSIIPKILVVVIVPDTTDQWLSQTEAESVLKYCAYWHSLKGLAPTNQRQIRVQLQRTNVFSVASLHSIMNRIGMHREI